MGDEPADALAALWPRSLADLAVVGACAFFGFTVPVALFDSTVLFTYHPTCMSMGFGLLMTLGVGAGLKLRALGPGAERVRALWVHAATQTLALFLALGGFVAIYRNKAIHGKPHFTTTHGKLGLLTIVLTVLSPTIGAVAFKRLGLLDAVPEQARPLVKAVHRRLGLFTWCAGALATSLALPHPAVDQGSLTSAWQVSVFVMCAGVAFWHFTEPKGARRDGFAMLDTKDSQS